MKSQMHQTPAFARAWAFSSSFFSDSRLRVGLIYGYPFLPFALLMCRQPWTSERLLLWLGGALFLAAMLLCTLLLPNTATWRGMGKRLFLFILNTSAALVAQTIWLTSDIPHQMALVAAQQTDRAETLQLLQASAVFFIPLALTWLAQAYWVWTLRELPLWPQRLHAAHPDSAYAKWRSRAFAALPLLGGLGLPWLAPSLQAGYPYGVGKLASTYSVFAHEQGRIDVSTAPAQVQGPGPAAADLVVVALGESSAAAYWQVNGYPEETSPHTLARHKAGELLNFERHMSNSSATQHAVPALLSLAGQMEDKRHAKYRASVISVAKKGGYATAWISSQAPQPNTAEADHKHFESDLANYMGTSVLDEALLPHFDDWLGAVGARPALAVLHSLGSHIPFENRYSPQFAKWPAPQRADFPESQTENVYKNTILYSDHWLESLFQRLESAARPSLVVYVSDHAESQQYGVSRAVIKVDYKILHVPFMVWANTAWRKAHPQLWQTLEQRAQAGIPTSHYNIGPTLVSLAGLSYTNHARELDLTSEDFTPYKAPMAFSEVMERKTFSPPNNGQALLKELAFLRQKGENLQQKYAKTGDRH